MRHQARTMLALLALALPLAIGVAAQKADSADALLRAAADTATVDGDLPAAIRRYESIADRFKADRRVVATSLVAMGELYQKLGDPKSRATYERVVRDFADQKDAAALARTRLGGSTTVASSTQDRAVWTGPSLTISTVGRVSPDGRFVTGRDRSNGSLMVRDTVANLSRPLTPTITATGQPVTYLARHSVFSRDGKQLAYEWFDGASNLRRLEFRVAPWPDRGLLEPRRVFLADFEIPRSALMSFDWSPDGTSIAAVIGLEDRTRQLALIGVGDGSFRVLKSLDWDAADQIFFSPDGKYVAFDLRASSEVAQRDVFVLAIDGSREIPAVVHGANDVVMGWSPDGRWLLFSSDRTGSWDLWGLPFADGKPNGSPQLLKSDIGRSVGGFPRSLGLTTSGALYIHKRVTSRDITTARIDLSSGTLLGPPVKFPQGVVRGTRNPTWSPDGKHLAYTCEDGACTAIRSVATGQVRVLPRTVAYTGVLSWSPDGRSLVTVGADLKGRLGIFKVDAQSGETTTVALGDVAEYAGTPQFSRDATKVYFGRTGSGWVERDLASGAERTVAPAGRIGPLSPDGQYFAAIRRDSATTASVQLLPVSSGQPRELLRGPSEQIGGRMAWTPDGSAVIVEKNFGIATDGTYRPSHRELWLLPLAGGPPRKLDIDTSIWVDGSMVPSDDGFSLSPDGRSIAFLTGESRDEVWALENFLPASAAKR